MKTPCVYYGGCTRKTDTYVDPLSPTEINRPVESALADGAGVIYLSMRGLEVNNS